MDEKKNGTSKTGTLADIRAASVYRYQEVEVPEWGGTFCLRSMRARQAAAFIDMKADEKAELMPRLMRECLVDPETKQPLITSDDELDVLRDSDMRGFLRVQNVMVEMNGLNDKKESAKNA